MTSFVVVTREKEKRVAHAQEYCGKLQIDPFDITLIERDADAKSSIGIEDVKNMQKKIFLRPLKSPTKAIIIEESHLLTTEAQNALLKVLEEPPNNTIIMLLVESQENLLPTIISRCKIIKLEEQTMTLSETEREEYNAFLAHLPNMTVGERLKKAELLAKDKEKGIAWIGKLVLVMREELIKLTPSNSPLSEGEQIKGSSPDKGRLGGVRAFQQLHTLLCTSNVNPRMAIEDTLLALMQ